MLQQRLHKGVEVSLVPEGLETMRMERSYVHQTAGSWAVWIPRLVPALF